MSQQDTAGTPAAIGDNTALAELVPVDAPVRRVPTLDEIMPPLNRKGKRGALNAMERDYNSRRKLLAEVLEQMVPAHAELTSRLAAVEQELADERRKNDDLDVEVKRLVNENAGLRADIKGLDFQLQKSREAHDRVKASLSVTLMATTHFCRLTGMELTTFHLPLVNNWTQFKILGQPDISITVQPAERKLRIIQPTGHANYFDLTDTGQIQPKDALAILALLGVKRNLREALSAMATQDLFGTTPEVLDNRTQRVANAFGNLAVTRMLITEPETAEPGYGFLKR